jgi:transitional endoplasmic reticulum ATPase
MSDAAQWRTEELRVQRQDFVAARRQCRPSSSRGSLVVDADQGFEKIGGLSHAKAQLAAALVAPLRADQCVPDGVLLHGPSGVGKSLLAKAAAKEAGASLIMVNGPELFSKWLGETEEAVRHVFKLARELAPSLIFFDQLDAIAPVRGRSNGSWSTERVVHQLVAELDALSNSSTVGVIATTNRLDLVDDALLQPGRFGTRLAVALPDTGEREAILNLYLGKGGDGPAAASLAVLADGLSGAQLRALAQFVERESALDANAPWEQLFRRWQQQ